MKRIHFLGASDETPLTKTFSRNEQGELEKSSYPMRRDLNSFEEKVENIEDLFESVQNHAEQGHCLSKGMFDRQLHCESRAGHTTPGESTDWIVLDNDYLVDLEPQPFLELIGLGDVDHILQYSASAGIEELKQKYHIFILLDKFYTPENLKLLLKHWNLTIPEFRKHIKLNSTNIVLTYPLDTTVCQNDKLIYIAPPICKSGVTDVLGSERIKLNIRNNRYADLGGYFCD